MIKAEKIYEKIKYNHGLFLNPYTESSSTSAMRIFPPVGLEYIATSAKEYIQKITVLDLRQEQKLCEADNLVEFIQQEKIDFIGVSIGLLLFSKAYFKQIIDQ